MIPNSPIFRKLAGIEPYLLPAIVALVALSAFGLGRLSAAPGQAGLRVLYPEATAATPLYSTAAVAAVGGVSITPPHSAEATRGLGNYVASKNGSKYYLVSCSSANRIKAENKVYFGSAQQAAAAGYEPAANCPGI